MGSKQAPHDIKKTPHGTKKSSPWDQKNTPLGSQKQCRGSKKHCEWSKKAPHTGSKKTRQGIKKNTPKSRQILGWKPSQKIPSQIAKTQEKVSPRSRPKSKTIVQHTKPISKKHNWPPQKKHPKNQTSCKVFFSTPSVCLGLKEAERKKTPHGIKKKHPKGSKKNTPWDQKSTPRSKNTIDGIKKKPGDQKKHPKVHLTPPKQMISFSFGARPLFKIACGKFSIWEHRFKIPFGKISSRIYVSHSEPERRLDLLDGCCQWAIPTPRKPQTQHPFPKPHVPAMSPCPQSPCLSLKVCRMSG